MFEPEWMEYFQRESPFAYYCVIFIGFLWNLICYGFYVIPLVVIILCITMAISGVKGIKIKFIQNKKLKRLNQKEKHNQKIQQDSYLNHLDKKIKKKKKHS